MRSRSTASLLHQAWCAAASLEASTCRGLLSSPCLRSPAGTCTAPLARGAATGSGPSFPAPRHDAARPAAAAAGAAASTSGAAAATPLSALARQREALAAMPMYPKLLGFAGAIPFLTLTPAMVEAAGFPHLVDTCAQAQLVYGGTIVTFLGAVHWGLAMSGAAVAASGPKAAALLNERYVWSVVPSLAAVPALLMQPAQGSLAVSILLFICYLSDASYFRAGSLPAWYMTLRGWLTLLAAAGMLSTTAHYMKRDIEKARRLMEADDAKRAARLEARAAAATAAAAVEAAAAQQAAAAGPAAAQGQGQEQGAKPKGRSWLGWGR